MHILKMFNFYNEKLTVIRFIFFILSSDILKYQIFICNFQTTYKIRIYENSTHQIKSTQYPQSDLIE